MKQKHLVYSVVVSAVIAMSGCDVNTTSLSCKVSTQANGTKVLTCPDGTSTTLSNGTNGTDGAQGTGAGISTAVIPTGDARCAQGNGGVAYTTFVDYHNTGVWAADDTITSMDYICNGATGATGSTGSTGSAGASSSVSLVAATSGECANGGWEIKTTTNGVTSDPYPICNGSDGAAGANATTATPPLSLMQLIAPCGLNSSAYKEQLMLFSDGTLLGDFSGNSSALSVRLSLLPDGSYVDTDDSGCAFTVSTANGVRSMTWGAGSSANNPSGWSAGGWSWTLPVAATGATAL